MKQINRLTCLFIALLLASSIGCSNSGRKATRLQSLEESPALPAVEEPRQTVDLTPKPLGNIPVGTIIGTTAPQGWSNLIVIATPTMIAEDERDAPKQATYYAKLFKFTLLANVARASESGAAPFYLERVALGFATPIDGKETIISGKQPLNSDLNFIGRLILTENEKMMAEEVKQVVRTKTMLIFDPKAIMLYKGDHVNRILRHAILVDPANGQLYTMVWLLNTDYTAAEDGIQLLPPNMQEKRWLSLKREKFKWGTIPEHDAFALRQVPQGTAIPYSPQLKQVATIRTFDEAQVPMIEATLRAAAIKAAAGR